MTRTLKSAAAGPRKRGAIRSTFRDPAAAARRRHERCTRYVYLVVVVLCMETLCAGQASSANEARAVCPFRGNISRSVTLPGTVRASQQATLYAKVAGYLRNITVDKGDRVQAGQVVAEIEVPELVAESARQRAELAVAESDFKRLDSARGKAPDLVTAQSVDEARGRMEIAKANLERIQTLLNYARVTAPFAGIITARSLDAGAFVPAATSGSAAQTAAIVTVADFNTVRVQVSIPEVEASRAAVGQHVSVSVDGLPGRTFSGKLSRISYALEEATRTMLVEADLPNPDLLLRPGMFAVVRIDLEEHTGALLVPISALVQEKANAFVFLAIGDRAKKTAIKTGFNDGVNVEIAGGISDADRVIVPAKTVSADGAVVNLSKPK